MKMNKISGNKGEWSEIYAFLKLLGEKRVYGADGDLNIKDDIYYDINKIIREETKGEKIEYVVNEDLESIDVMVNNEVKIRFKIGRYAEEAEYLFGEICSHKKGNFTVDRTFEFMESICCTKLKAPSGDKTDIVVEIHDHRTGMNPTLGFSIKSLLGSPSTLLNPSKTTNFIFELIGATDIDMQAINSFNSSEVYEDGSKQHANIIGKSNYIRKKGLELVFVDTESKEFKSNMIVIESALPRIISEMLKDFYINGESFLKNQVDNITKLNPLEIDMSGSDLFYNYKIKKFLLNIATGMVPGSHWDGKRDATGGYFIVKETGEVVCYHLYNSDDFEEYLLKNTYMDKPSTTRYGYGSVNKTSDGRYLMKLNLQIRFKKIKTRKRRSAGTIDKYCLEGISDERN